MPSGAMAAVLGKRGVAESGENEPDTVSPSPSETAKLQARPQRPTQAESLGPRTRCRPNSAFGTRSRGSQRNETNGPRAPTLKTCGPAVSTRGPGPGESRWPAHHWWAGCFLAPRIRSRQGVVPTRCYARSLRHLTKRAVSSGVVRQHPPRMDAPALNHSSAERPGEGTELGPVQCL